jgi:RHS repeat-associated protein
LYYDGWNRIAEYTYADSEYTLAHTYLWGLDLSETPQGAGGVGGLLCIDSGNDVRYYPAYDLNGNVIAYLDNSGQPAAHYQYDPFGNLTVDWENTAADFPYRFSTKPQDPITGLYYYGYRYYDPVTGRWPSRDPVEEEGGINLYSFLENDQVNGIDKLGQVSFTPYIGKRLTDPPTEFRGDHDWGDIAIGSERLSVHAVVGYDNVSDCVSERTVSAAGYVTFPSLGRQGDRRHLFDNGIFLNWGDVNASVKASSSGNVVNLERGEIDETFKELFLDGLRVLVAMKVIITSGANAQVSVVVSARITTDPNGNTISNGIYQSISYDGEALSIAWNVAGQHSTGSVTAIARTSMRSRCCVKSKE